MSELSYETSVMVHKPRGAQAHKLSEDHPHEHTYVLDIGNVTFFITDIEQARKIRDAVIDLVQEMGYHLGRQ